MHKVSISLKHVQSFIFEVPRLKEMLGANVLIGETMRNRLTELAAQAVELKYELPASINSPKEDPLDKVDIADADRDDPGRLYRCGILARDGGQFIAVFGSLEQAQEFIGQAEQTISSRLPGVLFDAQVQELTAKNQELGPRPRRASETHLANLPCLHICQETGHEPASPPKDGFRNDRRAAESVQSRHLAGQRFYDGGTRDIIGLLRKPLRLGKDSSWKTPDDLNKLCSGQYLALIHADGNQVGLRYKEWREKYKSAGNSPVEVLKAEAAGEAFFHSMRVAVRRAVIAALDLTFPDSDSVRPYQVLMLGGDDLLLACRASHALAFCRAYAAALDAIPLTDGTPLYVGMGVAIAKASYPLHRLHELAEALGASAKRLYRSLPTETRGSVVDWQVVTQSWFGDLAAARRQSERICYRTDSGTETLCLSARPYRILPDLQPSGFSLAELLDAIKKLKDDKDSEAGRSALRALRAAAESGRLGTELAWNQLPEETRKKLGENFWDNTGDLIYLTRVLDMIGLKEIERLGSKHP